MIAGELKAPQPCLHITCFPWHVLKQPAGPLLY